MYIFETLSVMLMSAGAALMLVSCMLLYKRFALTIKLVFLFLVGLSLFIIGEALYDCSQ